MGSSEKKDLRSMNERTEQLPPNTYSPLISKFLVAYYRGPGHPLKLRILDYIETLLGRKRIIVSTDSGFSIAVDKADLIQRHLLYEGIYEPELTVFLTKELNESDIFFDIGANIGYYTCLALSSGVKSVVAFEPDPLNCTILNFNVNLNNFNSKRINVIEKGVGEEVEVARFNKAHVANIGVSGFGACNVVASFDVEVETLDHLIDSKIIPLPTILKIDVEGWEEKVLNGAVRLLRNSPPRIIVFEADCDSSGIIKNQRIVRLLEGFGYLISLLPRASGRIQERENYIARLT